MIPQQVTRSHDPPPIPLQLCTHNTPHNSPQQGSSKMNIAQNVSQFQSQQTILCTPSYTQASTSKTQLSTFTTNTIHTNPQTYTTTSRTLSRPPLPLIPNNSLSYSLSSTNINNIQQPKQYLIHN